MPSSKTILLYAIFQGILGSVAAGPAAARSTPSSNTVTFTTGADGVADEFCFKIVDYSVSSGEANTISQGQTGCNSITYDFNRKGTGQVASWWNNLFPSSMNTFGHTANALNFAARGDLTITMGVAQPLTIVNVGIAQGHTGSSNNWWFGCQGATAQNSDLSTVTCPSVGTGYDIAGPEFTFQRGIKDVNNIRMTGWN